MSFCALDAIRSKYTNMSTLYNKYHSLAVIYCTGFLCSEVAAPWTEETVRQCLYLYLSLLPLNHRLVHELAAVYTEAIADIKRSVLRVIEQPVSMK